MALDLVALSALVPGAITLISQWWVPSWQYWVLNFMFISKVSVFYKYLHAGVEAG